MRERRIHLGVVIAAIAGCNSVLGIGEPVDGTGGNAGTGTNGGSAGSGGVQSGTTGSGGDANGGSGAGKHGSSGGMNLGGSGPNGGSGGGSGSDAGESGDGGGGASGGGATDPVVITTRSPISARLNIEFETNFRASGGDGGPYTFEFGEKKLPTTLGVVLERDGTLTGAPTATGTFDFDVVATDGASRATEEFALNVSRSRWLVYESDEEEFGTYYLYAVDVTVRPPLKTRLPYDVPRTNVARYPRFAFSPDGKHLAYLANFDPSPNLPQLPRLFVMDMTSDVPGDPVSVSGMLSDQNPVMEFAWSPDSRGLAFAVDGGVGIPPVKVYYAALTDLRTTRQVGAVSGQQNWDTLGWVGPNVLTYSTFNALSRTRPFVNIPGQPFEELYTGRIQQVWPEVETALVRTAAENECLDGTWNLVDFRDGSPVPRELVRGYALGSPGLEYLAYRDPDTKRYDIYRPWDTTSIASFESGSGGTRYCSPGAWSRDDDLFVAGGDGGVLVVTTIANDIGTPEVLNGNYGVLSQKQPPVFSPNDEWLGFSTSSGAYVAKKTASAIGAPSSVDPAALPVPLFGEPLIRFSPDSSTVAYAEPGVSDRPARAYIASLTAGHPEGSALDLGFENGSGVHQLTWSPHSTELALGARRHGGNVPWDIHLVQQTPNGFVVTKLNGPTSCSDTDQTCELVTAFVFQP